MDEPRVRLVGHGAAGHNESESISLAEFLDASFGATTPGTIIYRDGVNWVALAPGAAGAMLILGADGLPAWLAAGTEGQTLKAAADGTPTWTT